MKNLLIGITSEDLRSAGQTGQALFIKLQSAIKYSFVRLNLRSHDA
jgi:hypothetical protein